MGEYRHGKSGHPLYMVWTSMKQRCQNENRKDYYKYGGRGIKVCREWKINPAAFIEWAISNGWEKGLQLDRIDNNKHYDPSNCRFVTGKENCRNTRNNVRIKYKDFDGVLPEFAEKIGIATHILYNRIIILKWDVGRAAETPLKKYKSRKKLN